MNRFWGGVLAVVLGAIVGTLVSKEIAMYFGLGFWAVLFGAFVGAGFGGASAWVGADVPHFMNGVSRAWREASSYRTSLKHGLEYSKGQTLGYSLSVGFMSALGGVMFTLVATFERSLASFHPSNVVQFVSEVWEGYTEAVIVIVGVFAFMAVFSFSLGFFFKAKLIKPPVSWRQALYWNPITAPLASMIGVSVVLTLLRVAFSLVWLYQVIVILAIAVWLIWEMRTLFRKAYNYIHTYQRRCAFVGAVVGVLAASFTGHSVLVGAVVGVLTFMAEYQLATRMSPKLTPR